MTFQKTALLSLTLFTAIASISGADAMRGQETTQTQPSGRRSHASTSAHTTLQPTGRTSPIRPRTSDAIAPASRTSASGSAVRSSTQLALDALARITFKTDKKAGELDRFALRQGYVILQKLHAKQALSRTPLDTERVNALNLRDEDTFKDTQAELRAFVAALSDEQAQEFARKFEREVQVKAEKLGLTNAVQTLPAATRTSPTRTRPSTARASESTAVASRTSQGGQVTLPQNSEEVFHQNFGQFLTHEEIADVLPTFVFAYTEKMNAAQNPRSSRRAQSATNAVLLATNAFLDCMTSKTPEQVLQWAKIQNLTQEMPLLAQRISEMLEAKKNAARGTTRDELRSLMTQVRASIKAAEVGALPATAQTTAITRSSPTRTRPATASASSSRATVASTSTTNRSPVRTRPAPVTEVPARRSVAVNHYRADERIPLWLLKEQTLVWEGKTYTPLFPNRWEPDGSFRFYTGEDGLRYIYSVGLDHKISVYRHIHGTSTEGVPVSFEENNALVYFDGINRAAPVASSAATASRSTTLPQSQGADRFDVSNAEPTSAEERAQGEELYADMTSRLGTTAHSPVMTLIREQKLTPFLKKMALEAMEHVIAQQPSSSWLLDGIKENLETIRRAETNAPAPVRAQTSSVTSTHPVTTNRHMIGGEGSRPVAPMAPLGEDRFEQMLSAVDTAFAGAFETVLKKGTWFDAWVKSSSIAKLPGNAGKVAAIRALQYHKGTKEAEGQSKLLDEAIQELINSLSK